MLKLQFVIQPSFYWKGKHAFVISYVVNAKLIDI